MPHGRVSDGILFALRSKPTQSARFGEAERIVQIRQRGIELSVYTKEKQGI